jgi:uncharacterized protein
LSTGEWTGGAHQFGHDPRHAVTFDAVFSEDRVLLRPTMYVGNLLNRLDPRAPLVFDNREVDRRPGSSKRLSRTAAAPADMGIAMLGVPESSPIELDLLLESVLEGVLASGTARVRLAGECARCLDPIEDSLEVKFQELYVYPESDAEEDEATRIQGDYLDLEPVLRDAVVLALPFGPVCDPACGGLCPDCGVRLADEPGHTHGDWIDPRWEALTLLTTDDGAGEQARADEDEE